VATTRRSGEAAVEARAYREGTSSDRVTYLSRHT
jgi:hypothetical protein